MQATQKLTNIERAQLERRARAKRELEIRRERRLHNSVGGLTHFVKYFWDCVEPNREYKEGWALHAVYTHLEAVADGRIFKLAINISPGAMKSLSCNVFFPAWLWACRDPHKRVLAFSYASYLTERDNQRFLDLIQSTKFQRMYGNNVQLREKGKIKVSNTAKGWKFATSVGGVGTGERADIITIDDAHNVSEGESKKVRESTIRWLIEAALNRLNDMETGAVILIGQRVHAHDVFGAVFEKNLGFVHLNIPMEYDPARHCTTSIGWSDPRTIEGENFFPERFTPGAVEQCRKLGSFVWASQYQQSPEIREGGLLPRSSWQLWDGDKWPKIEFRLASLDPAFTAKDSNDPSGFTIWGVFRHPETKQPSVILMWAWRKWLTLHGPKVVRLDRETDDDYRQRAEPSWGLVENVADCCKRFQVDRLLIESKASGHSVAQEFARLFPDKFDVTLVDPGSLDKEARAIRVQHILENGQIYYPNRKFAEMVIEECSVFPRGEHDDLCDASVQSWYWLRQNGFLKRDDEILREQLERTRHKPQQKPLYPILGNTQDGR